MRAFQKEFPGVPPEEILQMVTLNSARALRQENALGGIRRGCRADLISIPCSGTGDVFAEIIAFEEPVDWILLNGKEKRNTPHAAKLSK